MADPLTIEISGMEEFEAVINSIGENALKWAGAALFEEGTEIMNASKEIVPVDLGPLKASGTVHPPEQRRDEVVVTLSYGGPAVDYAIVQHETPPPGVSGSGRRFRHRAGQSWKYLENPAMEATRGMAGRLANRLRARIAREAQ